jgi:bacterioferritin-associated ferredoxin
MRTIRVPQKATRTMYICICNAVTERQVRECAAEGIKCVEQLAGCLGVGAGCGRCRESAAEILSQAEKEKHKVLAAA